MEIATTIAKGAALAVFLGGMIHANATPPPVPFVWVDVSHKQIELNWNHGGEDTYRIYENPDGVSGFTSIGFGSPKPGVVEFARSIAVHKYDWLNAQFYVEVCNDFGGCSRSSTLNAMGQSVDAIAYLKGKTPAANDAFGSAMAQSEYGDVLAIGASGAEVSGVLDAGAVHVYARSRPDPATTTWTYVTKLTAPRPVKAERFGTSIAVSDDGLTMAVGAPGSETVYLYEYAKGVWKQTATLIASGLAWDRNFGDSLALSGDGTTLVVGAPWEAGASRGVNGDEGDLTATHAGAAYVFNRYAASVWKRHAYLKASNTDAYDRFGAAVAITDDGARIVVGAYGEDSGSPSLDPDETMASSGAVYVYDSDGAGGWNAPTRLKASPITAFDSFGVSVALDSDGDTLAIGAYGNAAASGAVFIFSHDGVAWSQEAQVQAPAPDADDRFGATLALDDAGEELYVGAYYNGDGEDGSAVGMQGNLFDNSVADSGAVFGFTRSGSAWTNTSYVKASTTEAGDGFGCALTVDAGGDLLVVGACGEDGLNNTISNSGAAFIY